MKHKWLIIGSVIGVITALLAYWGFLIILLRSPKPTDPEIDMRLDDSLTYDDIDKTHEQMLGTGTYFTLKERI